MVDKSTQISVIENVLIALNEGASDEKFAAVVSLEQLLLKLKDEQIDEDHARQIGALDESFEAPLGFSQPLTDLDYSSPQP
jgi:hypothetical protein